MYRGITNFKCHECCCKFTAPDMEYAASVYSAPQPCPKCGSMHTLPSGMYPLNLVIYRQIWKKIDNQ